MTCIVAGTHTPPHPMQMSMHWHRRVRGGFHMKGSLVVLAPGSWGADTTLLHTLHSTAHTHLQQHPCLLPLHTMISSHTQMHASARCMYTRHEQPYTCTAEQCSHPQQSRRGVFSSQRPTNTSAASDASTFSGFRGTHAIPSQPPQKLSQKHTRAWCHQESKTHTPRCSQLQQVAPCNSASSTPSRGRA